MRKRVVAAVSGVAVLAGLFASSAMAAPPERADDPFVCPVLTVPEQAKGSGQFADLGNGESTILPGNAGSAETFNGNVPSHATNGDGTGSPGGAHSAPGDTDYGAVWSGNQP
jgi:ABC-type phosphate transport system substrate-binding protein